MLIKTGLVDAHLYCLKKAVVDFLTENKYVWGGWIFILTGSPTEIRLFYKRDYTNSQNISKNLQEQNTNNHTKKH